MSLADEWLAGGLESVPFCPICGSHSRSLLYDGLVDQVCGVAPGKWSLYRCESCESAWLDPRPTHESIGLAYANYYTHKAEDHPVVRRKGGLRTFLHDALNDYRNTRFGLGRVPANRHGRWLIPLIPSLRAAVDAECRHLPPPPTGGGRLLDVGFGNGGFMKLATEMGWRAEGIDFDAKAVDVARSRGLNVRCAGIEDFQAEAGQYDVITLSHVIEHVHDHVGLLHELYRLLKPGGMLWLETPNISSLGARKYGPAWRGLEIPRHLAIFSLKSIQTALVNAGFEGSQVRWRGLVVFNVFAESEAIAMNTAVRSASRGGKPKAGEIAAEILEMLIPSKREFLTMTAIKPDL